MGDNQEKHNIIQNHSNNPSIVKRELQFASTVVHLRRSLHKKCFIFLSATELKMFNTVMKTT